MKVSQSEVDKESAVEAALAGLDFYVRHQIQDRGDANYGRFPFLYDINKKCTTAWSTSWETAVMVEAMLIGYCFTEDGKYLDFAGRGIDYIKSLQHLGPENKRLYGVFREETPHTEWAHTRDALTAALALLDRHRYSDDTDCLKRAQIYAEWFAEVAMEKGWPVCTVRFDEKSWEPEWCASCHSGSALLFYYLFKITGKAEYKDTMSKILDIYNSRYLDETGRISVIRDRNSDEALDDGRDNSPYAYRNWEIMHQYNDDFGALANLCAYNLTGQESYLNCVQRFMQRMGRQQREDGGFGCDEEGSVPSAAGAILVEVYAGKKIGLDLLENNVIENAVMYMLNIQKRTKGGDFDGAFMDDENEACGRTGAYSVMGLLRYAGADDLFYSIRQE